VQKLRYSYKCPARDRNFRSEADITSREIMQDTVGQLPVTESVEKAAGSFVLLGRGGFQTVGRR